MSARMMASASPSAAGLRRGPPSLLLSRRCPVVLARASASASASAAAAREGEVEVRPGVFEGYWTWRPESMPGEAHRIRYQRAPAAAAAAAGKTAAAAATPPVVLVHGFGSNADQFRKTTGALPGTPTYAVDLLGYGLSDKPDPRLREPNSLYNFSVWGEQLGAFLDEVVFAAGDEQQPQQQPQGQQQQQPQGQQPQGQQQQQKKKAFLTANSVGGLAALEAALLRPEAVAGVQVLNISLRGLHVDRQPEWQRPLVAAFQRLLRDTPLGESFFASVAQPRTVKNILRQAYGVKEAVTDELVGYILNPGLQPGAARVFLDFISYSGGPLPERLMARLPKSIPLSVVWGKEDPWESVVEGRRLFARYAEEFVELEGVGHCPMDEAPERVNPLISAFVARHSSGGGLGEREPVAVGAAAAVGAQP